MSGASFFDRHLVPETQSTNDDVKAAALAGAKAGYAVQALRQSGGKGRAGRVWSSPEGNLYLSFLLRPACSLQEAGLYSFLVALAVRETAALWVPPGDIALKWPNDVLVRGRKISGILLESLTGATGELEGLVVGVGINVASHPTGGLYEATDLAAEGPGPAPALEDVAKAFLAAFDAWRLSFEEQGFTRARAAWLSFARKGALRARLPAETVEGTFEDLDEKGCLILRLADGKKRAIASGDVFFD